VREKKMSSLAIQTEREKGGLGLGSQPFWLQGEGFSVPVRAKTKKL
jgi:hypothetical protein